MDRPLIAVVGDANKCTKPDVARRAARELGLELARRNCRILVFSSSQEFIEWETVEGYLSCEAKIPERSIEVRYPATLHGRFPNEVDGDRRFVRSQQGGDWEASIYPSFAEFDGIVLVGGNYTTKISGLLAMGSRTPVVSLAGMGGGAHQVWQYLQGAIGRLPSPDELNLMAVPDWHPRSASDLVDALLAQRDRKLEQQRMALQDAGALKRASRLRQVALLGAVLFVLVLLILVELMEPQVSRGRLWLLFAGPAIAGASAALIRMLWDAYGAPASAEELPALGTVLALGLFASGVAGLFFLLPQLWILEKLTDANLLKLAGFAVPIGLIAGLTMDRVFARLIRLEVSLDMPGGAKPAAPKPAAKTVRR